MAILRYHEQDFISDVVRKYYGIVSLQLSDTDQMYRGDASHYLACGASALNAINAAIVLASINPKSFLDFGSGAGRVTRWIRAAHPHAYIGATDIREADLEFCSREFAASTWISGINIDELEAPSSYDIIWAGSVLTHLPEIRSRQLINKFLSWLNPSGIIVISLHGRHAYSRSPNFDYYGVKNGWANIQQDYLRDSGYGYSDYDGQSGYGISMSKASWSARMVEDMPEARLLMFSEMAWDHHHDILAIQKLRITI